jgi:polyphosphate kinase
MKTAALLALETRRPVSALLHVPAVSTSRSRHFLNRELSWIDFDRRVLELAADETLPLLDRVKFCAIASSNLDEFFAVRMAELEEQVAAAGVARRSPDGRTPAQVLGDARRAIVALQETQDRLWRDALHPALTADGIRICTPSECRPRELRSLAKRFDRDVLPLLTPIAVPADAPLPHLQALNLNVCAIVASRLVCISVPQDLPRFLEVGSRVRVPLEDVIAHSLAALAGGTVQAHGVIRITRDADVSVDPAAEDLLEALETELRRRRFGQVVRLEVSGDAPVELRDLLPRKLSIGPSHVYETSAPLGLAALLELVALDRRDLKRRRWRPVTPRQFAGGGTALLAQIRRRDLLAHHPYDAYDTSVEHFVTASHDSKVAALKATVYRTGKPSRTLSSLVDAAEKGKDAVCLVELRARFDELRNIEWSRALDRAGVHVVYGTPDFKVHAKLCLLVRRERDGVRRYVHVGSGNYHASNASMYEDLSLFTADEEIAADVADLFNAVTGQSSPTVFRKLLVAPWFLREGLLHEINQVAAAADARDAARIRIKVNALVDPEIVDALYAASRAGATVEIITRGICVLRPGVPGLSEGITVRSVLGPFLEHSRILSFRAGDRLSTWIGSPDLMPRNLDRRIEVLAPVEDARLRARISGVLDALLADSRFAWELHADGSWHRVLAAPGDQALSAQELLMKHALARAKKSR